MADLLFTTDLENASKEQLKALAKRVREETGKAIDLRKSNIVSLRQYLQDYLTTQAVEPSEEQDDVVGGASATVTDAIFAEVEVATESEINRVETGEIEPEPEPELIEVACPPSFNRIARSSIDIILYHSDVHGTRIDSGWLCGILSDCVRRSIRPEQVKEPLILEPHIFLGLAGLPTHALDALKNIVRRPEEFGDLSPESKAYHENISRFLGYDSMSEMLIYHQIRDNFAYIQQRFGISSLEVKHCAIRDKLFTYQDYNSQLQLLDSDRAMLELEAPKICKYFQRLTPDYEVFRVYDDETEKPLPEGFDLARQASIADYAWIYAESFDWKPHSGGGYVGTHCDRLHPDRIELCLSFWDGDDYASFLRLTAYHPDPSRRPWLAKQST